MQFMRLPAIQAPTNSLIDFSGLGSALGDYGKALERNYSWQTAQQAGKQAAQGDTQGAFATAMERGDPDLAMKIRSDATREKSAAMELEQRAATLYGGVGQDILNTGNEAQARQKWQRLKSAYPEFNARLKSAGIDPEDFKAGASFLVSTARGYRDPLDVAARQSQIDLHHAQIEKTKLDIAQAKMQPVVVGVDAYGNQVHGFVDPINRVYYDTTGKPITNMGQINSSGGVDVPGLHGDEFLKTLPPALADEIKGYAEGRLPYSPTMAKSPRGMALTRYIQQYDPTFDAVNYASRNATRKDFTSGTSAKNITSFNTAIGHLGHLASAIDGLGNSGIPMYNAAANTVRRNVDPDFDAKVQKFDTARTAVTEELARAFKGMGATVTEVHEWEKKFNSASSPQALRGAISEAIDLLESRINSLGNQYNKGMGSTKDPLELLTPEARATWDKLKAGGSPNERQPAGNAASARVGDVVDGASFGHPGEKYRRTPNGFERVR